MAITSKTWNERNINEELWVWHRDKTIALITNIVSTIGFFACAYHLEKKFHIHLPLTRNWRILMIASVSCFIFAQYWGERTHFPNLFKEDAKQKMIDMICEGISLLISNEKEGMAKLATAQALFTAYFEKPIFIVLAYTKQNKITRIFLDHHQWSSDKIEKIWAEAIKNSILIEMCDKCLIDSATYKEIIDANKKIQIKFLRFIIKQKNFYNKESEGIFLNQLSALKAWLKFSKDKTNADIEFINKQLTSIYTAFYETQDKTHKFRPNFLVDLVEEKLILTVQFNFAEFTDEEQAKAVIKDLSQYVSKIIIKTGPCCSGDFKDANDIDFTDAHNQTNTIEKVPDNGK